MITEAIVIGTIEAAVFWEDDGLHAVRLDPIDDRLIDCSRDVGWLLSTGAERRRLPRPPQNLEELAKELRGWSQRHRALTMMLSGMDAELTDLTRTSCILAAEECLSHPPSAAFARARLLGCPLPDEADLDGALRLASEANATRAAALYGDLSNASPYIATVRRGLEELLRQQSDERLDPEEVLRAMVDSGLVAGAVQATVRRDRLSLSELVFRGMADPEISRALPRPAHFLAGLVGAIRRGVDEWPQRSSIAATAEEDQSQPQPDGNPFLDEIRNWKEQQASSSARKRERSRPSLSPDEVKRRIDRVNQQKKFVIENLKSRRVARAENAIIALIQNQERHSTFAQVCMSLCDLGAHATRLGLFELAERLYGAARLANDEDSVPASGYAETLRQMGRLDEALAAYAKAKEDFPHDPVPANGYAETLRQMGKLDEALAAYAKAKEEFPGNVYAANGYAETLRQMGKLGEALAAYAKAKEEFPGNVYAANGYAETLRQMGKLGEALAAYAKAKEQFPHDPVPATGYAETLRQMGKLDEALAAYAKAKEEFPGNVYAANGYAETLRQMGQMELAEKEFRGILEQFPTGRVARNALACLLIDLGRISEAKALVAVEEPKTEQDWRDFHVLAMTFLKEENYEEGDKRLSYGVQVAPFQTEKDVFTAALAFAKLRRRQFQEVSALIERDNVLEFRLPAVAVVNAHAKAELGERDRAEESLVDAERSRSAPVVRLSDFLRRRYALGPYSGRLPDKDEAAGLDALITEAEFDLALRIAA